IGKECAKDSNCIERLQSLEFPSPHRRDRGHNVGKSMSIRISNLARLTAAISCAFASGFVASANAELLKVGLASEPTAFDPHYHQGTANDALTTHVFEPLVGMSGEMKLEPRLAESWEATGETTWTFK